MPGPTNGDSSVTPSRSGVPGCAFSMNSRYRATVPSSTARVRQGVAKLPPATTLGVPASAPSAIASCRSDTTRIAISCRLPGGEAAAVHDGGGDADEVVAFAGCPGDQADSLQLADLVGVGHRLGVPD